jgi:protein-S-isoprenylcysteine O-methyltransferase Ste14
MRTIADASLVVIAGLWTAWIALWLAVAFNVKRTRWRENRWTALWNRVPVLLGAALLIWPRLAPAVLSRPILPAGPALPVLGAALVLAGLVFALWARRHLGRNWSGDVTVKEGHALIRSGPYRLVRHPIYSGVVLALAGTALAIGSALGFVATVLILIGFVIKLQVEEARMRETFPDYADYCRRTARLIPGVY